MAKYGSDKPDLRNPIEMQVVSEHFAGSGFELFEKELAKDGTEIRALPAPGAKSGNFCKRIEKWGKEQGLPGMGYIVWKKNEEAVIEHNNKIRGLIEELCKSKGDSEKSKDILAEIEEMVALPDYASKIQSIIDRCLESNADPDQILKLAFSEFKGTGPLRNNIGDERTEAIRCQLNLGDGDAAFFLAGKPKSFVDIAGRARTLIAEELGLIDKNRFELCWIVTKTVSSCAGLSISQCMNGTTRTRKSISLTTHSRCRRAGWKGWTLKTRPP